MCPRPVGHPDGSLIGQLGAAGKWAKTDDRTAATAAARKAAEDRFVRLAREKFGDLPPDELARRAEYLRKQHFVRMALKSVQARRRRKKLARP
jgi:hypothetical protein